MFTKRSLEGELMIDHTASPGLPKGFMQEIGLGGWNVSEGKKLHAATLTCCHCGGVYLKNPDRVRDRGHCQKCDAYTCDGCMGKPCTPHLKTLDQVEQRAYLEQQNSLVSRFGLIKG